MGDTLFYHSSTALRPLLYHYSTALLPLTGSSISSAQPSNAGAPTRPLPRCCRSRPTPLLALLFHKKKNTYGVMESFGRCHGVFCYLAHSTRLSAGLVCWDLRASSEKANPSCAGYPSQLPSRLRNARDRTHLPQVDTHPSAAVLSTRFLFLVMDSGPANIHAPNLWRRAALDSHWREEETWLATRGSIVRFL